MNKTCSKCKIEKCSTEFYERKTAKDGLRSQCKSCMILSVDAEQKTEYDKTRYLENKDEIDKRAIRYYHDNKERKQAYDRKNRSKVMAKRRERYRTDLNYKLTCNFRSRLNQAVRRDKKCAHSIELLGCSVDELKKHIESKFTKGMSWEHVLNGKIHIDHIIPCSAFDLTKPEEQRKCFHYTNLQPLWAKDNFRKHTKIIL